MWIWYYAIMLILSFINLGIFKASEIIYESMGPHFDPKLKIVFDDCREQLEAYYMENDNE